MPRPQPTRNAALEGRPRAGYTIRVRQDGGDGFTPEQLEDAAKRAGQSVNAWIIDAINDKI